MADKFKVHGINFLRTGKCNSCGLCGCNKCPHGVLKDGKYTCAVYDTREKVCEYCTKTESSDWYRGGKEVTHKQCIDFPKHPFVWVINEGKCGYSFATDKQEDEDKLSELEVKF